MGFSISDSMMSLLSCFTQSHAHSGTTCWARGVWFSAQQSWGPKADPGARGKEERGVSPVVPEEKRMDAGK